MTDAAKDREAKSKLAQPLRDKITSRYGKKGKNALQAIDENRVLRYLDFFVVIGNSGEYVVADDFCTCHDFSFRQNECWHILAVKIAEYTGCYTEIEEWYQDKWAKNNISG